MRSFTIRGLMAFVVVAGVALAGLRNADGLWAGCLLLATLGLLLASVLGAVYTAGQSRAGWLGFSLFGSAYLALVLCPIIPGHLPEDLPTSQLLNYIHTRVSPPQAMGGGMMMAGMMMMGGGSTTGEVSMSGAGAAAGSGPPPANRWKTLLPGAANRESFACIGHCLFALALGLLGASIARGFQRRASAAGTDAVA